MSKITLKAALKLLREVQDTMAADPQADVRLIFRGSVAGEVNGEAQVGTAVNGVLPSGGLPVDASFQGGWSRHWEQLSAGEFVVHVHRPPVTE